MNNTVKEFMRKLDNCEPEVKQRCEYIEQCMEECFDKQEDIAQMMIELMVERDITNILKDKDETSKINKKIDELGDQYDYWTEREDALEKLYDNLVDEVMG